jgi:hypothetical protein
LLLAVSQLMSIAGKTREGLILRLRFTKGRWEFLLVNCHLRDEEVACLGIPKILPLSPINNKQGIEKGYILPYHKSRKGKDDG